MITHHQRQNRTEQNRTVKLSTQILSLDDSVNDYTDTSTLSSTEHPQFKQMLEGAKIVGETRKRFWNMLATTINKTGYTPPQDRQTTILDLGCGRCDEGLVLSAYFGGNNFGSDSNKVKLVGVDINQEEINKAISSNEKPDFSEEKTKYALPPNYEFYCADATNLDSYPQVPQQADVVVIRHEQISADQDIWTRIFQTARDRVNPEGIILITSFSDIEHETALKALAQLDCGVVVNERNQFAKPTNTPEVSIDRNVAIVRKTLPETTITKEV